MTERYESKENRRVGGTDDLTGMHGFLLMNRENRNGYKPICLHERLSYVGWCRIYVSTTRPRYLTQIWRDSATK